MSKTPQHPPQPIYCCYCESRQILESNVHFNTRLKCPRCKTEFQCIDSGVGELHVVIRQPKEEEVPRM